MTTGGGDRLITPSPQMKLLELLALTVMEIWAPAVVIGAVSTDDGDGGYWRQQRRWRYWHWRW